MSSTDTLRADVSTGIRQMSNASDQVRIAAAQALSTSRDPRAVTALAVALTKDAEPTIRREAALALGKVLDERTAYAVREVGLDALAVAATSDPDLEVCVTAGRVQAALAGLARKNPPARAPAR